MSASDPNNEFLAILPAFISEATEQIDSIEALLLEIEESPQDKELLNSLFRCAHTVKGSAGIFGLNRVVEFTHHIETLLDKMREGLIPFGPHIGTLLLQCNDQMRYLIELGFDDDADTELQQVQRQMLVASLQALTSPSQSTANAAADANAASTLSEVNPPVDSQTVWLITANFGSETFRSGMDPMAVARYLGTMGDVVAMAWNTDRVPPIADLVHDTCYTSFVLELRSSSTQAEIEEAFSFVEDDCEFHVIARETAHEKMKRSIDELPDVPRIGDMLLAVGAVSESALSSALESQEGSDIAEVNRPKLGTMLVEQAGVSPDLVQAALSKQQKIRDKHSGEEGRFIRVQADRLDTVINLLGELVIAGAGTGAALAAFEDTHEITVEALIETLVESNQNMNRLIEEIRNSTLGLRMVPVGETFTRFKRVVRDTASSLGKEVQFEIQGGETELDKSMVEKIADPLMHLVRNSLDHGLEAPAERVENGKAPVGHLTLSARHEAGAILIRIEDDGRGINRDRVLQRAWDKGLVERGVVPGDDAINMLIFEPGFSTAEQVTNLSGRGVGMDVVRSNIEALRGSIKLNSRAGKGLTVDIRLPLTLAIIDGFLVGVGDSKFVLPLESVVEVIEFEGHSTPVDANGRHCVELRGTVLPVVRLRSLYTIETGSPRRVSVVVVQSSMGQYGIQVESLLGQNQTVIKPLGRLFKTLRGISGSAILGSGEVALILDVASLGQLAAGLPGNRYAAPLAPSNTLESNTKHTTGELV